MQVVPGNTVKLKCPDGHELLNKKVKPIKNFFIVEQSTSSLELGPLAAGEFEIKIPCDGNTFIEEKITIKEIKNKPQKFLPLTTQKLAYPDWITTLLYIILVTLIATIATAIYLKLRKKKKKIPAKRELKTYEKLDRLFNTLKAKKFYDETSPSKIKQSYNELHELFRTYIDESFEINTEFYTTREFIETIRPIAPKRKFDAETMSLLESVFLRSDQVRFAKYIPNPHEKQSFTFDLNKIYKQLRKQDFQQNAVRKS